MSFVSSYKDLYQTIFNYYNQNIFDISEFSFNNIYCSDDIQNDILLFCSPKPEENTFVEGATIVPNDLSDEIVIVINIKNKISTSQHVSCLIHELTHVHDFIEFSKEYYNKPYALIQEHEHFEIYKGWSEFHAYALGHYYCCSFMNKYTGINSTDTFIKMTKHNLKLQLKEWTDINYYTLNRDLGFLYALDMFKHRELTKKSYAHKYLPRYIDPKILDDVLLLYDLYSEATLNNEVFDILPLIEKLRIRLYKNPA